MKKKYLIGGAILVIVLGAFIIINPFRIGKLDVATETSRRNAAELLAVRVMVDVLKYYNDEKVTLEFTSSPAEKALVQTEISDIVNKYGGVYDYKIFEISERGMSVKTYEKTSGAYYCVDTMTGVPAEIKSNQFTVNSDCTGARL